MAARGCGLRAAEAVGPGETSTGATGSRVTPWRSLAWLVCPGLRPKVVHDGSLQLGRETAKKMELLAAERAKETELLSLLVEHQVQAGACAPLDLRAGDA
eukprot:11701165-Alexandrium_andersonii.AAC.1